MRLIILLLSMGAVTFYGYALAGLAGFFIGKGRLDYIVFGLVFGTGSAGVSLLLWRRWLSLLEKEMPEDRSDEEEEPFCR